jgi:hypothetical protein
MVEPGETVVVLVKNTSSCCTLDAGLNVFVPSCIGVQGAYYSVVSVENSLGSCYNEVTLLNVDDHASDVTKCSCLIVTGLPGVTGPTGARGLTGSSGTNGVTGSVGPTGPQGIKGGDGYVCIQPVSVAGTGGSVPPFIEPGQQVIVYADLSKECCPVISKGANVFIPSCVDSQDGVYFTVMDIQSPGANCYTTITLENISVDQIGLVTSCSCLILVGPGGPQMESHAEHFIWFNSGKSEYLIYTGIPWTDDHKEPLYYATSNSSPGPDFATPVDPATLPGNVLQLDGAPDAVSTIKCVGATGPTDISNFYSQFLESTGPTGTPQAVIWLASFGAVFAEAFVNASNTGTTWPFQYLISFPRRIELVNFVMTARKTRNYTNPDIDADIQFGTPLSASNVVNYYDNSGNVAATQSLTYEGEPVPESIAVQFIIVNKWYQTRQVPGTYVFEGDGSTYSKTFTLPTYFVEEGEGILVKVYSNIRRCFSQPDDFNQEYITLDPQPAINIGLGFM